MLTGAASRKSESKTVEHLGREAVAAAIGPATREVIATGAESVRKIAISPNTAPIEMPPLRR